MKHEIMGMNLLVFVVLTWIAIVVGLVIADNLPDVWHQHQVVVADATAQKKQDSELTVEMPAGSFDPDETMQLALYREYVREKMVVGLPALFVIDKRHAVPGRRRHAKDKL